MFSLWNNYKTTLVENIMSQLISELPKYSLSSFTSLMRSYNVTSSPFIALTKVYTIKNCLS